MPSAAASQTTPVGVRSIPPSAGVTVFLGPYHSYLEETLVSEICRYKAENPLSSLLVLTPSDALCHRLKVLLALEHRLSLLNVFFLSFYPLSRKLFEEQVGRRDPALQDDFFFEEALRHLLRAEVAPPFAGLDQTKGGCAALWQTLRDLRDGCVDPDWAISALTETHLAKAARPLLSIYRRWCAQSATWGVRSYGDLDREGIAHLPSSPFLKTFQRIFYYGFYDLTQAQIDLFQSVVRHFPTTLFFPLVEGDPDRIFAQRFYERYVHGLVTDSACVQKWQKEGEVPQHTLKSSPTCTIIGCAGAEEEVAVVAGEIVRLVEAEGLAFEEIGVVARTRLPYADLCASRFAEQGIPMAGTAETPLLHFPLAQTVLLLMQRSLNDDPCAERLELSGLPKWATWSEYATRWTALLSRSLRPETTPLAEHAEHAEHADADRTGDVLIETLAKLADLDRVAEGVALADFVEAAHRALSRAVIVRPGAARGVTVMDAMSARGIPFRALFILGLNERIFPRAICEDPFLKDRVRREIETTLGCKVGEKQAGYDEEKLLFTFLTEAAREHLYCLYQRCDEAGKTKIPSWYLDALHQDGSAKPVVVHSTFVRSTAFNPPDRLLPRERVLSGCLNGEALETLLPVLARVSPTAALLCGRVRGAAVPLSSWKGLTPYDGMTGPLPGYWESVRQSGISPTALESYGRCPFQFFATQVLALPAFDPAEAEEAPGPKAAGWLCHAILQTFYQTRIDEASRQKPLPTTILLKQISRKAFADYASRNPVGLPLAWEVFRETLVTLLSEVIEKETALASHPVALEVDCTAQLDSTWPAHLAGLPIRGRIDRIDRISNEYRVIDYKYKAGKTPTTNDRNPAQAAVRGLRLQLPFYRWLGEAYLRDRAGAGVQPVSTPDAAFYFLAPKWADGPLVMTPFQADEEARIKETVALLLTGIRDGRFFILPGDYCNTCAVRNVCRKDHPPSRWRAAQDPVAAPHHNLRKENVKSR